MRKCKITVYDYSDARHNASATHYDKNNPPEVVEFNVEAWCVGGDEGVQAYWVQNEQLYIADGDDGHWWLNGVISVYWVPGMIKAMEEAIHDTD
jgi:hypothetical protein